MRTIRCYVDAPLAVNSELQLQDNSVNHLLRVLRLADGASVTLFNGDGYDYACRLSVRGKAQAVANVEIRTAVDNESPLRIALAQGIARGEKMDLILQKATELGVAEVWPLITDRTEVKLDAERLQKRMVHWRGVLCSACEQSGRARIPVLHAPRSLAELVDETGDFRLRLTLDPQGQARIASLRVEMDASVLFAIGPEGGLSAAEREQLTTAGFVGLILGPRILRTETAGLAALAALQGRFGDLA